MQVNSKRARFGVRRICFAVLAAAALLMSPAALAQTYDNPGLGQKPVASHPQDYKPLGIRAGSFMLHPGVELAAQWHDNILYTNQNEVSDTIWHVRPYITAQSTWSRHSFNIRLAADVGRYDKYSFRDYEDYFLQLGGTVDTTARGYFSYGLDWMQLHEDRNIRSAEQGIKPTVFRMTGGNLGYDHTFNRFSVGVLYALTSLDYDNNINLEGEIIDNQDRNRTMQDFSARFGYQFKSDKQAYLTFGLQDVEYDQQFDRSGYDRSSSGWYTNLGMDFSITGVLSGNAYVTYREREYEDPRLLDVSGWGLGAGLTWMPTLLTSVRANAMTTIEDTTQANSSGYLRTLYSVRVDHELLRDLQLMAQVSYYNNDYELLPTAPPGAREEDDMWTFDVGATYFINRWAWVSASYKHSSFDTNVANDDFKANQAWLVLGFER